MVKASYTLKDGTSGTAYARDYDELFRKVNPGEIAEIHAAVISVADMRQGREKQ